MCIKFYKIEDIKELVSKLYARENNRLYASYINSESLAYFLYYKLNSDLSKGKKWLTIKEFSLEYQLSAAFVSDVFLEIEKEKNLFKGTVFGNTDILAFELIQ